jgi:hypothetical protein
MGYKAYSLTLRATEDVHNIAHLLLDMSTYQQISSASEVIIILHSHSSVNSRGVNTVWPQEWDQRLLIFFATFYQLNIHIQYVAVSRYYHS